MPNPSDPKSAGVDAGKVADSFSRFMSNTNGVQETIAPLLALLKSIAESMDYTPPEARGRLQALAANVLNHIAHAFELTGR